SRRLPPALHRRQQHGRRRVHRTGLHTGLGPPSRRLPRAHAATADRAINGPNDNCTLCSVHGYDSPSPRSAGSWGSGHASSSSPLSVWPVACHTSPSRSTNTVNGNGALCKVTTRGVCTTLEKWDDVATVASLSGWWGAPSRGLLRPASRSGPSARSRGVSGGRGVGLLGHPRADPVRVEAPAAERRRL